MPSVGERAAEVDRADGHGDRDGGGGGEDRRAITCCREGSLG